MARWAIGHFNDKGSMNGMTDAKGCNVQSGRGDARCYPLAECGGSIWMILGVGRVGVWADVVFAYPLSTCLDAVCAVLCHVILRHNNGLQVIMTLMMVTQDNNDIQRRDPWPRHFLNLGCIEGQIVQVKH